MPSKRSKPSRPLRRRLAAILGSTLVSLLLAEAVLRIAGYTPQYVNGVSSFHEHDPVLGRRGKPSFAGRFHQAEFDVQVELDDDGFRQVDGRPVEASMNRPSVFVLGDSFAWGWGVERDESFVALVARATPEWRWRNYALCGSGTLAQYLLFERHVRWQLEPGDVVLLAFYENDFADNVGTGFDDWTRGEIVNGAVRIVPPPPVRSGRKIKNALKDVSYLFNLCAYGVDRMKMAREIDKARQRATEELAPPAALGGAAMGLEMSSDSYLVTRYYLEALRADVAAAGAKLVMICLPGRTDYGETFDDGAYAELQAAHHRAALRCAGELGIPALDLLPALRAAKERDPTRLTYEHDLHWNPRGHKVVAEAVVPFLAETF